MLNNILIGIVVLLLASCGGGSDGGNTVTPTDPNQIFNLSSLNSTTPGTVYSAQLTGSDSNGVSYSGSVSMLNRAQTMLDGILVTPQDLILSLTGGGTSINLTATSNIDVNGNLISVVIQTTGLTCTAVTPDNIPTTVKIGESGTLSTVICSDNTTQESNWRVEDAGNGSINVITNGTFKDQFNTIISVTDVTFTIDGNGNIISFKTVSTQSASNFTLTYQST